MTRIFRITLSAISFCMLVQTGLTSCTKTNTVTKTVTDTVTVVQKDTVVIKDTAMTAAILTANSWKPQEIRGLLANNYGYYLRGGASNSVNLDNEYMTFNANGTGFYVDNTGTQYTITWNFTDATNKKIIWTWNLPTPVIVTWENIRYKNGAISYTEYYTQFGQNELTAGTRMPK